MSDSIDTEAALSSEVPWYRRWFGDEYLDLYPHRDRQEAEDAVALFHGRTGLPRGSQVLDLACGAGRHLRALLDRGLQAVGLDLSFQLLQRAGSSAPEALLLQGDMRRLPFPAESFDAVTSFFTSFGYFDTESEDRRVLSEARRVLRGRGHLLLDFLNAHRVVRELSARDEEVVDGRRVIQERRLVENGKVVEKLIRIEGTSSGQPPQTFRERVRLYTAAELETLLASENLRPVTRLGDYAGGPAGLESPRIIVLARAV